MFVLVHISLRIKFVNITFYVADFEIHDVNVGIFAYPNRVAQQSVLE